MVTQVYANNDARRLDEMVERMLDLDLLEADKVDLLLVAVDSMETPRKPASPSKAPSRGTANSAVKAIR